MSERLMAGRLNEKNIGEKVLLKGWVQKRRDLGGLIFIDLRDKSGLIQVVFNPDHSKKALETAENIRSEYVIEINGTVVARDEATINPSMKTGKIEVNASSVQILNKAKTPPFTIQDETDVSEDVRLKYRYLDLRRNSLQETFRLRHQTTQSIRNYLNDKDFLEMETPILTKSTPEGARDYLVPSRVHPGEFYALPQSPQLFKQLIMMGGFERYYQIARCFRDEDLRADRQPEFTQIDIETSFLTSDEIMDMTEHMMKKVMKEVKDIDISLPLPRMPYQEAMDRYGSDKPDTRFDLELIHVSDIVASSGFKVFSQAVDNGGKVALLNIKGKADNYSRKDIDKLTEYVKVYDAKGLAWLKADESELKGPIAKFLSEEEVAGIRDRANVEQGDLLLFVADKTNVVYDSLGALRLYLGKELGLIDESKFHFLWVTDWPLLEYDEGLGRYFAAHHPFTSAIEEDLDKLETDPASVRANAYDLVLNGFELGGGSIRIHQKEQQDQMFKVLGFSEEEARSQFGFLLDALEYGAPPHGGIALGLDRIIMLLAGRSNLRDTILFPKTASASDLMTAAPSGVSDDQLQELSIQLQSGEKNQ
ncbi:aspartyl-tRNA synthetase [Oceanobacillus iheyensis HTE831]|uniref:Aspartate--tRNA ligase n=1 Tax=Oceanobacillus iheyensis (strain DSM 14371 / CIP 107618 / JCM 11309 / KCTC 3954 / HTE831) TaxID=221109 RepID=SYD_OCEIH|nr:aspartate--tRNA ligase [Oceanobacillus iheyensis]Q8EPS0.1 RecName: Full=Aspartate--tRNA ligase; AltName: Full=Aspartyl-tRNA synthetase; Short=AspRS [Oceanobacillus iheyensis HTE831]BAC13975.1 aspartyl-tRNA synthetase [Oceanobacillus iheyensis HTE831]